MRNDMGSLVFKGSGCKNAKVRQRLRCNSQTLPATPAQPKAVVTMDFRLGDEPEGFTVLRYLSVRQASEHGGWVTAELVRAAKGAVVENDSLVDDTQTHTRESMRGGVSRYESKEIKLSMGVLRRFLGSRVGRNWGQVLGEFRRGCDGRSFQGHTIEESVLSIVVTNVEESDGQLWNVESGDKLEDSPDRCRFFVHPTTGLLQHLPRVSKSAKQTPAQRPEQVDIDASTKLVRVAGLWYVVGFQPIPDMDQVCRSQPYMPHEDGFTLPKDVILGQNAVNDPANNYRSYGKLTNYPVDSLKAAWGAEVYAVSKRQAGSRELKRYLPRQRVG